MSEKETKAGQPEIRDYRMLAVAALLLVTVILVQEEVGWWAAMPLVLGVLGILRPGAVGPVLVTFLMVLVLGFRTWFIGPRSMPNEPSSPLSDLFLAVSTLIYVAAHSRLLTIHHHAVPPDTRRELRPGSGRLKGRWLLPGGATKRSASLLTQSEFLLLLGTAPLFALVGYLLWIRIAFEPVPEPLTVPLPVWRALLVVWSGIICLCGVYVLTSYLRWFYANALEGMVYLQDQLWNATRGEQRRVNSWLTWARLRQQKKEKAP
jgi:hypothetical protein